ncbi:MAG: pyridoxamine 5'-phosphate oxidase family protein [Schleiferilactobacillus perolens]|jgi:general stress protein 26|uniref:Pyridoxamine 5'-phosphate oxidase N-terminal domain-containing protein n=1 Tax=Schleiferilactobacillus perolens DSM 12744 TaxID=1423792 RepID=A0A0R1MUN1_9LACO|nr:pyridoxamine 5'-phosphate oxidase family protein [Schleiferilactobacillus perolens]KRL11713.1 hypothetical protein FD09_GL000637 [Schleiferilactobacillus perolens DSM 12744]MCI1891542.1 pyridoxamine 5'-phosphate oxidase family protein [Schleiferilactobacillus harbinensis]MCI1913514.1 pyridoxamine 5'-phosphate oxidase family protein [Schleiferilactobacillus harbinensis]
MSKEEIDLNQESGGQAPVDTIGQAEQLLKEATVMQFSTIDKRGFPNIVALTPLKLERSLKQVLFYTDRDTTTVHNIVESSKVSIYCFNERHHCSVGLQGYAGLVSRSEIQKSYVNDLTKYQKSLNYKHPVFLRFTTIFVKVRYQDNVTFQKLLN